MTALTPDQALASAVAVHSLDGSARDLTELAASLVGHHNTTQHTPYLSVRARVPGFSRADLDELMWDHWQLVRFRAMRLTMFVFPTELLEVAAAATWNLRKGFTDRWFRDSSLTEHTFSTLAAAVEDALASGPMTVRKLREELGVAKETDLPGVVGRMCDVGRLVGGRPPRSWRSTVRQYHRWQDVLPAVDVGRWSENAATAELIRRYISSYGPVTVDDISWWTGLTKTRCREALAAIDSEEITVDGWPGPLFRTGQDSGELPDAVCALPILDPYVQGYRNRTRFLADERFAWVYDWGGNAAATLVHRGRVIGVWQFVEKPTPSVLYHLFDPQPAAVRNAAEQDLAATGRFFFDRAVDVIAFPEMPSLRAEGGRSAAHPLDGKPHRASRR